MENKLSNGVDHTKNVIEVKNISYSYGNNQVLSSINFVIHKGDYLGIVGPNGAGKTTLLKIILGLLSPSTGSVKLFGEDVEEFKDWSKVGYVPQNATNFDANFPATVKEVVAMGRFSKKGLFRSITAEDEKIIQESIAQAGLSDFKNRLIGDLSGGQQQRVFIARALAGRPEIIFLDEPTTGVDKKSRDDFYDLLKELNQKMSLTLVLVSHDIERILKEAMHIACVDHTLTCHASPKDYLKSISGENIFGQNIKILPHHHNQ
jgi:zinc transport system ATP-binding protein